jgi:hypothetical protein
LCLVGVPDVPVVAVRTFLGEDQVSGFPAGALGLAVGEIGGAMRLFLLAPVLMMLLQAVAHQFTGFFFIGVDRVEGVLDDRRLQDAALTSE